MERDIYLDNSSTTVVCDSAVKKVVWMMTENYGNPASLHSKGIQAEREVEKSRSIIAKSIGVLSEEIYFTDGGTQSNNMAVFGAVRARKRRGNRIITSSIEHPSVLKSMQELQKCGFDIVYLTPDSKGVVSAESIHNAIDEKTILVSIMLVNNEIGSILPIEGIQRAVKKKKAPALIHTDAVQAFGKLPFKVSKIGADMVSVSSHKIHGPKGVGALYIKKGVNISPIIFGGGQEKGLRSGTSPTPLIAGFGEAVLSLPNLREEYKRISQLRSFAVEQLKKIKGVSINNDDSTLPYILNFSVRNIRSETLLHFLAAENIFVSSGSSCSGGNPSYVLKEAGFDKGRIDSALRASFSRYNSKEDIIILAQAIERAVATLVGR